MKPIRRGNPEDDRIDGICYDNSGRMEFHPDFHFNQGKPFKLDDLIYICKYHKIDEPRTLAFAIGKTEKSVATMISKLKKEGLYFKYRELPYDQWEQMTKIREGK
ncbi:DNA-entry nuclease [Paenibacillus sp. 2RAB27]|uniref:DNA-entry nuclease n=1 Tax=Paenibacillus sp. 2RAB27 TaxID=3232991 RepID=UPI003F99C891